MVCIYLDKFIGYDAESTIYVFYLNLYTTQTIVEHLVCYKKHVVSRGQSKTSTNFMWCFLYSDSVQRYLSHIHLCTNNCLSKIPRIHQRLLIYISHRYSLYYIYQIKVVKIEVLDWTKLYTKFYVAKCTLLKWVKMTVSDTIQE